MGSSHIQVHGLLLYGIFQRFKLSAVSMSDPLGLSGQSGCLPGKEFTWVSFDLLCTNYCLQGLG